VIGGKQVLLVDGGDETGLHISESADTIYLET
jgi:hypothetical protein